MSRITDRGGASQLLTSVELSTRLPVAIYRILTGSACTEFPQTNRSNYSSIVLVRSTSYMRLNKSAQMEGGWTANLPLVINGLQWQNVAVPVMEDTRVQAWLGASTSPQSITLSAPVINAQGAVAMTSSGLVLNQGTVIGTSALAVHRGAPLFQHDQQEMLNLISKLVLERAIAAGY